jgi:CHAT domain-containing protein
MIISLWEVPDKATARLMQLFYANLAETNDYYSAFQKAQKQMQNEDPLKWAGFMLVGE